MFRRLTPSSASKQRVFQQENLTSCGISEMSLNHILFETLRHKRGQDKAWSESFPRPLGS